MVEELWRKPKVLAVTGMQATWLYEEVRKSRFPRPVKIGERAVGWRRSEVEAWLNALEPGQTVIPRKEGRQNDG